MKTDQLICSSDVFGIYIDEVIFLPYAHDTHAENRHREISPEILLQFLARLSCMSGSDFNLYQILVSVSTLLYSMLETSTSTAKNKAMLGLYIDAQIHSLIVLWLHLWLLCRILFNHQLFIIFLASCGPTHGNVHG